jgi:hypothetical protein
LNINTVLVKFIKIHDQEAALGRFSTRKTNVAASELWAAERVTTSKSLFHAKLLLSVKLAI